jgi:hypothetical protein
MSSNWNRAFDGSLHIILDDIADNEDAGRDILCCDHGDLDCISSNDELLAGLLEGSEDNGSFNEDEEGDFNGETFDVTLGLFEGEDEKGGNTGCVDIDDANTDDNVRLEDTGGNIDKAIDSGDDDVEGE